MKFQYQVPQNLPPSSRAYPCCFLAYELELRRYSIPSQKFPLCFHFIPASPPASVAIIFLDLPVKFLSSIIKWLYLLILILVCYFFFFRTGSSFRRSFLYSSQRRLLIPQLLTVFFPCLFTFKKLVAILISHEISSIHTRAGAWD